MKNKPGIGLFSNGADVPFSIHPIGVLLQHISYIVVNCYSPIKRNCSFQKCMDDYTCRSARTSQMAKDNIPMALPVPPTPSANRRGLFIIIGAVAVILVVIFLLVLA